MSIEHPELHSVTLALSKRCSPSTEVRIQRSTLWHIVRLYSQRKAKKVHKDHKVLTKIMSDNTEIKRKGQQRQQYATTTTATPKTFEILDSAITTTAAVTRFTENSEESLRQSVTMDNKGDSSECIQRDCSSFSSNSSSSSNVPRKPASLNEIQDLYSALQDLVKKNVSGTPVLERRTFKAMSADNSPCVVTVVSQSPLISKRFHGRTSTAPEKSLQRYTAKLKKTSASSSFDKDSTDTMNPKHRRGLSQGTMEMVNNIMRISPFPKRRFSSQDVVTEKLNKKNNSSKISKGKNNAPRLNGPSSEGNNNKKWKKPNLFNRLRKGGIPNNNNSEEEEEEDNEDNWSEDSENSPPIVTKLPTSGKSNRRRSEGDALKIRTTRKQGASSDLRPMQKRSLSECSKKGFDSGDDNTINIDQLVAALDLETSHNETIDVVDDAPATFKSPEHELSRLESWFEKAAAEATMNRHSKSSIRDTVETLGVGNNTNSKHSKSMQRKKDSCGRRSTAIRRVSSSVTRAKEDKNSKRGKISSKNLEDSGLLFAKSTPDLSTDHQQVETLNNASPTAHNKVSGRLSPFTENKLKGSPSRKISLDVGRLPGVPLFYTPTSTRDSNNLLMNRLVQDKKLVKQYSDDIFYTERKDGNKNIFEKRLSGSSDDVTHEIIDDVKRNNSENQQRNKERPKSMFDYLDQEISIDDDQSENPENSTHLETGIQTDDNANFCRIKRTNGSHALSLSDLTKASTVQEKSLWDRLRKGNSNKKSKTIMT